MTFQVPDDGIILSGTAPSYLGYPNVVAGSLTLQTITFEGNGAQGPNYYPPLVTTPVPPPVAYVEGVDYDVNYALGVVTRRAGSAIPSCPHGPLDVGSNANHSHQIVWARYQTTNSPYQTFPLVSTLPLLKAKLSSPGSTLKVLICGDSTSTDGAGETQSLNMSWHRRMVDGWVSRWGANINYVNRAYGGTGASDMLGQVNSAPPSQTTYMNVYAPSLVAYTVPTGVWDVCAFGVGMNNHGMSATTFRDYLLTAIDALRASSPNCEVILVPTAPSQAVANSSAQTLRDGMVAVASLRSSVYVADHLTTWEAYRARVGRALLNNDINHPTNTGHWIYSLPFAALEPAAPASEALTIASGSSWQQSGSALAVNAPPSTRTTTQATAISAYGGIMYFDGADAAKFSLSLDGSTWTSSITIPAGTTTVYLGVTPSPGDGTLSARVGVPT